VDHQFAVGDRRSLGDAELIHILPRHLDPQIGQVRSRTAEIFGQGHELLGADLGPQAGCPFDLHEQLVRVDRPGTHLLAVVGQYKAGFRTVEIGFHIVHRGEDHGLEFVEREFLSLFQRIGEPERRDARNVRAGHRRTLHEAVIGTVVFRQLGRNRRQDFGVGLGRIGTDLIVAAGSRDIAARAVIGVIGRQVIGRERGHGDIIVVSPRVARHGSSIVAGGKDDHAAADGIAVLRFDEILDGIVLHARAALIGAVRSIGSRLASERTLDDRSSVVGGILDGFGGSGDSPRSGVVAREYLARHEFHPVVAPRAAGHAANADAVVIDGGHRTGHMCPESPLFSPPTQTSRSQETAPRVTKLYP